MTFHCTFYNNSGFECFMTQNLTFHSFKKFSKFESWNVLDVIGGGGKCNKLCYSASRKLRLGNIFSGVYLSAILSTFVGSLM